MVAKSEGANKSSTNSIPQKNADANTCGTRGWSVQTGISREIPGLVQELLSQSFGPAAGNFSQMKNQVAVEKFAEFGDLGGAKF